MSKIATKFPLIVALVVIVCCLVFILLLGPQLTSLLSSFVPGFSETLHNKYLQIYQIALLAKGFHKKVQLFVHFSKYLTAFLQEESAVYPLQPQLEEFKQLRVLFMKEGRMEHKSDRRIAASTAMQLL